MLCSSTSVFANGAFSDADRNSVKSVLRAVSDVIDYAVAKAEDLYANKTQRQNGQYAEILLASGASGGVADYLQILNINNNFNLLIKFVSNHSSNSSRGAAIGNTNLFDKRILLMPNLPSGSPELINGAWLCVTDFDSDITFANERDNSSLETGYRLSTLAANSAGNLYLGNCEYVSKTNMDTIWNIAMAAMN